MIRKDKIVVTVDNGSKLEIKPGTCVRDLLKKKENEAGLPSGGTGEQRHGLAFIPD